MELAAHDLMNEITSWIHHNKDKVMNGWKKQQVVSSIYSRDRNPKIVDKCFFKETRKIFDGKDEAVLRATLQKFFSDN